MRRLAHIGLIALIPALLNVSAAAASPILMPLCTGDGVVRMVPIPGSTPRPAKGDACCVKGCHGGNCRKRTLKEFEASQ
ncbi:MAG: hypothetical protein ABL926_05810 [Novosphingobium sp.]|uniref:hypothetical protein n=1 Tax=Novosphingobium sp. TaxID=1874826 RepID=UPI0032B703A4